MRQKTRAGHRMPSLENWVWWVKDLLWLANSPHTPCVQPTYTHTHIHVYIQLLTYIHIHTQVQSCMVCVLLTSGFISAVDSEANVPVNTKTSRLGVIGHQYLLRTHTHTHTHKHKHTCTHSTHTCTCHHLHVHVYQSHLDSTDEEKRCPDQQSVLISIDTIQCHAGAEKVSC